MCAARNETLFGNASELLLQVGRVSGNFDAWLIQLFLLLICGYSIRTRFSIFDYIVLIAFCSLIQCTNERERERTGVRERERKGGREGRERERKRAKEGERGPEFSFLPGTFDWIVENRIKLQWAWSRFTEIQLRSVLIEARSLCLSENCFLVRRNNSSLFCVKLVISLQLVLLFFFWNVYFLNKTRSIIIFWRKFKVTSAEIF